MIETDVGRSRILGELKTFMERFDNGKIAVLAMDSDNSELWDQENIESDFQQEMGEAVIEKLSEAVVDAAVVCNDQDLPVLLLGKNEAGDWDGIGVDKRLRSEVTLALETKFASNDSEDSDD